MIKPLQPGFRPWENHTTALRASEMHPFWWLAPPPSPRRGDFILRYALSEGIALRSFILSPGWGGKGTRFVREQSDLRIV